MPEGLHVNQQEEGSFIVQPTYEHSNTQRLPKRCGV